MKNCFFLPGNHHCPENKTEASLFQRWRKQRQEKGLLCIKAGWWSLSLLSHWMLLWCEAEGWARGSTNLPDLCLPVKRKGCLSGCLCRQLAPHTLRSREGASGRDIIRARKEVAASKGWPLFAIIAEIYSLLLIAFIKSHSVQRWEVCHLEMQLTLAHIPIPLVWAWELHFSTIGILLLISPTHFWSSASLEINMTALLFVSGCETLLAGFFFFTFISLLPYFLLICRIRGLKELVVGIRIFLGSGTKIKRPYENAMSKINPKKWKPWFLRL